MIREFKNGNLILDMEDTKWIDDFYNNEMFWKDLYFNQINGYMYLVNFRTQFIYDFSDCCMNILAFLEESMTNGKVKLYPMKKKESKQLWIDLNNGF